MVTERMNDIILVERFSQVDHWCSCLRDLLVVQHCFIILCAMCVPLIPFRWGSVLLSIFLDCRVDVTRSRQNGL